MDFTTPFTKVKFPECVQPGDSVKLEIFPKSSQGGFGRKKKKTSPTPPFFWEKDTAKSNKSILHPLKINSSNLKMMVWKMSFLFQGWILRWTMSIFWGVNKKNTHTFAPPPQGFPTEPSRTPPHIHPFGNRLSSPPRRKMTLSAKALKPQFTEGGVSPIGSLQDACKVTWEFLKHHLNLGMKKIDGWKIHLFCV